MGINNSTYLQKEFDDLIKRLTRCMALYIENLESLDDIEVCNRTSNILSKVSTTLINLIKVRGIKLDSSDDLTYLLNKLGEVKGESILEEKI